MLVLPATLTHAEAPACEQMLLQALRAQAGGTVVADASALARFDSSALAVLLSCRREALALDRGFAVHGLGARLSALASAYGVDSLLPAAGTA
jgi:phospholipid transport system transporter-binding protein